MIDHPDFDLNIKKISIVIRDFQHTKKTLDAIKAKVVKDYNVNIDYLNVSIRSERMLKLEESIINKLIAKMLEKFKEEVREKIMSLNIKKFNLDFLRKVNKS